MTTPAQRHDAARQAALDERDRLRHADGAFPLASDYTVCRCVEAALAVYLGHDAPAGDEPAMLDVESEEA